MNRKKNKNSVHKFLANFKGKGRLRNIHPVNCIAIYSRIIFFGVVSGSCPVFSGINWPLLITRFSLVILSKKHNFVNVPPSCLVLNRWSYFLALYRYIFLLPNWSLRFPFHKQVKTLSVNPTLRTSKRFILFSWWNKTCCFKIWPMLCNAQTCLGPACCSLLFYFPRCILVGGSTKPVYVVL